MNASQNESLNDVVSILWHNIVPRLARVLVWLTFAITHLVLAVALLAYLWISQTSLSEIQDALARALQATPGALISSSVTFFGISAAGALLTYAKLWQWALRKLLSAFLFAR